METTMILTPSPQPVEAEVSGPAYHEGDAITGYEGQGVTVIAENNPGSPQNPADDAGASAGDLPPHIEGYLAVTPFTLLRYRNPEFEEYRSGYWVPVEICKLQRDVARYLGPAVSSGSISELIRLLKIYRHTPEGEAASSPAHLCMTNGTYDLHGCNLTAHNPDHSLRCKLDYAYQQDALCPIWEGSLAQMFAGKDDCVQLIGLVQEMFGYCLVQDMNLHKFFILLGNGGNGKSVVLQILEQLLGQDNVSHAMLHDLKKGFVRAELENKFANICHEMSPKPGQFDSLFKAIVAGNPFEADRKFQASRTIRTTAKLVNATNQLPRLNDLSEGFRRRAVIIPFDRTFAQSEQDPHLLEKLTAELEGIFIWALTGLERLRDRGCFELPVSSEAALMSHMNESDPLGIFVSEALEETTRSRMKPADIHAYHTAWCRANGFSVHNTIVVGKRLEKMGYRSVHSSGCKYWKVKPKPHNGFVWQA